MKTSGAEYLDNYRRKYGEPTNGQVVSILLMIILFVCAFGTLALFGLLQHPHPTPEQEAAFEAKRSIVLHESGNTGLYEHMTQRDKGDNQ